MALNFSPGRLNEYLADLTGYKVGLALSLEELYDHLSGSKGYADTARESEVYGARLRSEEVEAITYRLMHRVGYTEREYNGDHTGVWRYHKYRKSGQLDVYQKVTALFVEMAPSMMKAAQLEGRGMDPRPYVRRCWKAYGNVGRDMAWEQIEVMILAHRMSLFRRPQAEVWDDQVTLAQLFGGAKHTAKDGAFIDQRFVDYLSVNNDRLPEMHWRRFEELTAEFFHREGFRVDLGPGSNDDGVDVRVWKPDAEAGAAPLCLIQCKRQKAKVEKVVIKGLLADVQWEEAEYGVIVTSSTLSPGAKTTIESRGYPIRAVERDAVCKWLTQLRTPGTGIIRI